MSFKNIAKQILTSKLSDTGDADQSKSALVELIGGGGNFDLDAIVKRFTDSGGDLAAKANSWLGDEENESISPSQLQDVLGADKISAFAQTLGIDDNEAGSQLSEFLPKLIDKSSRGGKLLDSFGGSSGALDLVSKFFK